MTSSGKSPGSAPLQQILFPLAWYTFPKLYRARACPTWHKPEENVPIADVQARCLLPHTTYFFTWLTWSLLLQYLTLSFMSLAMSKCLWQQTTASSNLPNTFNVLPRFPLALASPSRSPIVLTSTHHLSNNKYIMLAGLWSSHAGPTWSRWGHAGGTPGP